MMKPLSELHKHKNSDTAVFLGCGSSINRITKTEWKRIRSFDTWVSNFFVYHDFVPRFYHLELKSEMPEWLKIWRERKLSKGKSYDDVVFVIRKGRTYLTDAIGEHRHVYCYGMRKGKCDPKVRPHPSILIHRCQASFVVVLELLKRLGYERIVLFGVDLKDSRYFWTDDPKYGRTHNNTNAGREPEEPHTTRFRVPEFVYGFNKHQMNGKLFVGHRDTLLYPGLKYVSITELK